jgi:predicted ATPase
VPIANGLADLARHTIVRDGARLALSTREAELLGYLARAGRSVSREELLVEVWRARATHPTRAVDMCVRRLRAKIELNPAEPAQLITVLGEGYRFVPLTVVAAPPPPPTPEALTSFHGRAEALTEVRAALQASRLVTILGGPGLGKTRLARELRWPSRTVFCDLTSAVDADGLAAAVAGELGAPLGADPVDGVGDALAASGDILVILDNFEQLLSAAPTVARWLDQAPRARIVVTSRARLGVAGERLVALSPLSVDAAVAVLADRAAALGITGLDADASSWVAQRLDCVPLALELAAGRLRTLSLAQLADRLESSLRALVSPGLPERHATMRGAIAWSWDLLAPPERAMLAALSVFRGPFELEAVEEVVGVAEPWWPDELLGSLVDKSLVRVEVEATRRFHLFESVREYAAERLPEDEAVVLWRRHLRYYAGAAERLLARLPMADALRRLEPLRPELMAAWERASDADDRGRVAIVLGELLARRGPRAAFDRVISRALASPMSAEITARLLVIGGHYAVFSRDFAAARSQLASAAPLLVEASPAARGDAMDLESRLLAVEGDLDGCAAAMRASRALFQAAEMPGRAAWVAVHLALLPERARTELRASDREDVLRALDEAEAASRGVGDEVALRLLSACRARWALSAGDRDGALYWIGRADWAPRPISGDAPGTMEAAAVAVVEEALGRFDRALAAARHRAEARDAYAPAARRASAQLRVASFLAVLGRMDEAVAVARASLGLVAAPPAALRVPLAAVLLEAGDPTAALAELSVAGPLPPLGRLWIGLALLELRRYGEAEALLSGLGLENEPALAPLAALALAIARSPSQAVPSAPDPDAPDALIRYVDRRATVGRCAVVLATRSLHRVTRSNW